MLLLAAPAAGEPWKLGGDARYYQFVRVDDPDGGRRDAELGIFRLKLDGGFSDAVAAEVHAVASVTSPASTAVTSIASGTTRRLFDLQWTVVDEKGLQAVIEFDRLNVKWERQDFRLVAGRQAIT